MKLHCLKRQQSLQMSVDEAWHYFTSPYFLNSITPDFFEVHIESEMPDTIYAGLLICYRMRVLFGVPITWVSEITQCVAPQRMIYQQLVGPFKFFSHEVRIIEQDDGILLEDLVYYAMPFAWFGALCHRLFIGQRLQTIFNFRAHSIAISIYTSLIILNQLVESVLVVFHIVEKVIFSNFVISSIRFNAKNDINLNITYCFISGKTCVDTYAL